MRRGASAAAALGAALKKESCRVETLVLRKCGGLVGADKLRAFSEGLGENRTVRVLDATGNSIDDYAAVNVAAAVARNHTLEILCLQLNAIGSNGGGCGYRALSAALATRPSLAELRIGGNRRDGLRDFIRTLVHAHSLKALYLADPGGFATTRVKCEACGNIGYAAREACATLARRRPDLMICLTDANHNTSFLNEPLVHWEPVLHPGDLATTVRAVPPAAAAA